MTTGGQRRRIWGWWLFDWASQPYATLLLTFIFSTYFSEIARIHYVSQGLDVMQAKANAQSLWGLGLTISGVIVAVLAPVLGAIADNTGRRLIWIWLFSALYVIGAAGLWWLAPQSPDLILTITMFGIGLIGMEFATIFTNAMLPSLGPEQEIGRISGNGFALGYVGGAVALLIMVGFFAESGTSGKTLLGFDPLFGLNPETREGTRFVGPFTAIWYVVFMIPFFLWVREPAATGKRLRIGAAMTNLVRLIASLRHRTSLAAWLASSMLLRDALNGMYAFGGIYGAGVLGWTVVDVGRFGLVSVVAAAVVSWLGGHADRRWGPKPVIIACALALLVVCVILIGMGRESIFGIAVAQGSRLPDQIFYVCGCIIGGAGGAMQAAGRTMMARHTVPDRATEAFGLYALSGKATTFLAPMLITLATTLSGSQRVGISPLIVIFLFGLWLLLWVQPKGDEGQ
ncbi:MFS transporter [Paracoccus pacificus]|uniref:MFS transporter n=1 Tax=Paracoccus pacificus TaxID=1463598 RepID=A0ABW4RC27_9RHOB